MKEYFAGGLLVLCFAALVPTMVKAQGPAGAGANSTDAADYCLKHPTDSQRCLPPHDGIPPLPKPVSTLPGGRIQPGATDACPGCVAPIVTPPPAAPNVTFALPSPQFVIPPPPPPVATPEPHVAPQPVCDSACLGAEDQQNFQNGEAAGYVLGTLISRAISAHRSDPYKKAKSKYCKLHPDAFWEYNDGTITMCDSINAGHEVRQSPDTSDSSLQSPTRADQPEAAQGPAAPPLASQQLKNLIDEENTANEATVEAIRREQQAHPSQIDSQFHQQIRDEMEKNRKLALTCVDADPKVRALNTEEECDAALERWVKQREMYCALDSNGSYINYVDGKPHACADDK